MSRPNFILPLIGALALSACGGAPPVPDWQANAHAALAAHTAAYLSGADRVAASELAIARREVARTGAADVLARVELTACAAQLAALAALEECRGFTPLAADAGPAANAYAAYLAGRWEGLDAKLLPLAQQAVMRAANPAALLAQIDAPLSRLIAAAALFRAQRLPPEGITLAIDTAASQGWRRPLLAWLGVDRERLQQAGDTENAAARQRRIERIIGKLP